MNDNDPVIMKIEKKVARIILNNPQKGNVVNRENLTLLSEFVKGANMNEGCKVIVIEGKEKIFCKGMDFDNLLNNSNRNERIDLEFSEPYKNALKAIKNSLKPIIAKVDGEVIAGGMGIILTCDIIIASKDSKFGLTEVLFGIIPAYVFPLLLERASYKKARFMILSSTIFSGEEAYDLGIADEISDAANLNKIEKKYVKRISFSSPKALSLVKKYSDALTENKIDESLDYAQKELTELLNDGRNIENIKKFINGQKADWNERFDNS